MVNVVSNQNKVINDCYGGNENICIGNDSSFSPECSVYVSSLHNNIVRDMETILALQNKIKASTCLCAFFALSPFSISYCAICEMVKWRYSLRYSDALALTEVFPLKSSDNI